MELTVQEQIFELLRKAKKIIIALPERLTADAVSGGLALKMFLQKMQKDVDLVSSGRALDPLVFLPASDEIKNSINAGKSLVLSINTAQKKLDEISYQIFPDRASVYLKSGGAAFEASDVSFAQEKFPVDVIITLEAPSLEALGSLFEQNTDLFYETPKINIDHKASNELYGAVNLVEVSATSVGEILAGLLESFEASLLDQDIATALLCGIITKTNSFQHARTTPEAFLKASKLIGLGGRQQDIIKHFYKTKSLPLLKLWGRCLARLKTEEAFLFAYSALNFADLEKSGAVFTDILPALKELLSSLSGFRLVAILAEVAQGEFRIFLAAHLSLPAAKVLQFFPQAQESGSWQDFKLFETSVSLLSLSEAEKQLGQNLQALGKDFAQGSA